MRNRKLEKGNEMNRLYVAESSPSTTGAKADHRLVLRPSEVELLAPISPASSAQGPEAANSRMKSSARGLTPPRPTFRLIKANAWSYRESSSRPRCMPWPRP